MLQANTFPRSFTLQIFGKMRIGKRGNKYEIQKITTFF